MAGPMHIRAQSSNSRLKVTATLRGPFFEKDAEATFDENARRLFAEIAKRGEDDVRAILEAYPTKTGVTAKLVEGRSMRLDGMPFKQPGAVVTQTRVFPWKGHTLFGGSAAAEIVNGYRAGAIYMGGRWEAQPKAFRTVRSRLGREWKKNLQAELLKGIDS
jgi:hypothetical protein